MFGTQTINKDAWVVIPTTTTTYTCGCTWWGKTKTRILAPSAAFLTSGSATMFGESLIPGKYLFHCQHQAFSLEVFTYFTFSCCWLMISVKLRPSICSWKTHIRTVGSNKSECCCTFCPMTRAMADPLCTYLGQIEIVWCGAIVYYQLPEPIIDTLSCLPMLFW